MSSNMKTGVYTNVNGDDVAFDFVTSLSAIDKVGFVQAVTNTLVGDHYNFVIKNMIFDFMIIRFFTDIDVSDILDADDSVVRIERFLNDTNAVEIVMANADSGVIKELMGAVELDIEYKTGIHNNPFTPIVESLTSLLDTVESKIEDIDLDSMLDMAQTMGGISGELTPEKILEAYANSDMYKKQWQKLESDKINRNNLKVIDGAAASPASSPILSPTFEV